MKTIDTKEEFHNLISSEKKLIIVDFFATWCGPCKAIAPFLEGLSKSEQYKDVIFVKVDVDENTDAAEDCSISAMPTIQLYKDGQKVEEIVGANEAKIREAIDKFK